jgi:hypothetical protein
MLCTLYSRHLINEQRVGQTDVSTTSLQHRNTHSDQENDDQEAISRLVEDYMSQNMQDSSARERQVNVHVMEDTPPSETRLRRLFRQAFES